MFAMGYCLNYKKCALLWMYFLAVGFKKSSSFITVKCTRLHMFTRHSHCECTRFCLPTLVLSFMSVQGSAQSATSTYFSGSLCYNVQQQILHCPLSWYWGWAAASRLSAAGTCTFSSSLGTGQTSAHLRWTQTATAPPGLCLQKPVKDNCRINTSPD